MRKLISAFSLRRLTTYCTLFLLTVGTANAATVRGQLNRRYGTSASPAAGICVTVYKPGGARSARACSNSQGKYYLSNITPGDYQLEIWTSLSSGAPPIRHTIKVAEPHTDIPPITVP